MGDMLDLIDQHIAYAWSPDGKDRFTRKWSENLLVGDIIFGNIYDITGEVFNGNQPYLYRTDKFIPVKSGQTYNLRVYNRLSSSEYDRIEKILQYSDSGVYISSITKLYSRDYSYTVPSGVGKIKVVYQLSEDGINTFINNPKKDKGLKIEIGERTKYTPSPIDDYDNAVPRYIGRSLKDSTNPSDFTWEPNPERKPWTAYAQGVNGEGFSLMPYGENQITSALNTLNWKGDGWSGNTSFSSDGKKLIITALGGWRATRFKVPDELIGKKLTLSFNAILDGAKTTATEYTLYLANGTSGKFSTTTIANTSDIQKDKLVSYSTTFVMNETGYVGITTNNAPENSGKTTVWTIDKVKLELANTMGIPTPWTPAPSEDPLGAIPKYVGTAALPYEDWTKYEWDLNPAWLQQESNNNLATKVDNDTYSNDQSNVWQEISNRVTEEEAQAIQESLNKITGAYTDFVSTGGKHDQDLANLKSAINTDIQKLADKVLGFDFVNTWFRIGDGGLSIGEANSNFEILVSNDQITFYDSGTAVAYVSNQSFFINSGMIVDDLQIGKFKFAKVNDNLMGLFHIA